MKITRDISTMENQESNGLVPAGFVKFCKSVGIVSADGKSITFTMEKWREASMFRRGLGDLVHKVAGPIGQAIHWPCNERDSQGNVTTNLRPNSPCAKAREMLNKVKI